MTSFFHSLIDSLKVSPGDDDQVEVTVTLPPDIFRDYLNLLDSLTHFVHCINQRSRYAKATKNAQSEETRRKAQQSIDVYKARLVQSFDIYTAQGLDRKTAVKRIAADLRAENHPWRCPELVRSTLVASGRDGRKSRRKS
jgi:hypothetical protein